MEVTARAIIIEKDGLMVFYREKMVNGKLINYYALPGGHVEDGETLENTVIRELKEELDIDINIIKRVGSILVDNRREEYFLCERISGKPILSGEEFDRNSKDNYYEFRYLPFSDLDKSGIRALHLIKECIYE